MTTPAVILEACVGVCGAGFGAFYPISAPPVCSPPRFLYLKSSFPGMAPPPGLRHSSLRGRTGVSIWINGQVVDGRGQPLADVRSEASSRQRTAGRRIATSNASGQYVICDLRPGTYILTFARPGSLTAQRTSPIANFVATINAELQALDA